ncbi:MAG: hypothetical protein JSW27_14395 [Phycisphaerales bacterium]|nr:MAG: hypothetical protein JSW27_14395 [Phycisphaerales bacterium]
MSDHTFAGFGFGPIQAGLFAKEAFESGHFGRIVVAEIAQPLVEAVRANGGTYFVNVAQADGIETLKIDNVELLNPTRPEDGGVFRAALAEATEIVTSLPSVDFYHAGQDSSVAALIAEAVSAGQTQATIVYAAENNNHAAEILQQAVTQRLHVGRASPPATNGRARTHDLPRVQFLNTVIGKMSRVVTDAHEITELNLTPIAPGIDRAFLVEAFNHILVTKPTIPGFTPGIDVFVEKNDLLPFEEAKLYGHNAIHALLGFVGTLKGYDKMTELQSDDALMRIAHDAFLAESGGALIAKYSTLNDDLFTEAGYRHFAEDLLERMTNPYLADTTARAGRDALRKLGASDRIFGTMSLALEYGMEPQNMAIGALAGVAVLLAGGDEYAVPTDLRLADWRNLDRDGLGRLLHWVWKGQAPPFEKELVDLTFEACQTLTKLAPR